ncbi:hypothetical protein [Streptomyces halstedii]|uniref:hypothetical protein n=1 Tax=Streptomyces halstedii TaxID=1944 RepID=UPI0037B91325
MTFFCHAVTVLVHLTESDTFAQLAARFGVLTDTADATSTEASSFWRPPVRRTSPTPRTPHQAPAPRRRRA